MLNHDPKQRLKYILLYIYIHYLLYRASEIIHHPFFWDDNKKLSFLCDFSDNVETLSSDNKIVIELEKQSPKLCKGQWDSYISQILLSELTSGKYRRYDYYSIRDCLRFIRNKKHHFHDLPANVQSELSLPSGFINYFLSKERFPYLLSICYEIAVQFL